jgi:hypothetical protein
MDFLQEIQAITLMARGFGEIIKPTAQSNLLCKTWKQVPTGKDYLVARISQLHDICVFGGNPKGRPLELVQGLYWHQGGHLFDKCGVRGCRGDCDRVQVLLPELTLGFKTYPQGVFTGNMDGAVVFGHSRRLPKFFPRNTKKRPVDDEAACIVEDNEDQLNSPKQGLLSDSGSRTDTTNTGSNNLSTRLTSSGTVSQVSGPSTLTNDDLGLAGYKRNDESNSGSDIQSPENILFLSDDLAHLTAAKGKAPMRPPGHPLNSARREAQPASGATNALSNATVATEMPIIRVQSEDAEAASITGGPSIQEISGSPPALQTRSDSKMKPTLSSSPAKRSRSRTSQKGRVWKGLSTVVRKVSGRSKDLDATTSNTTSSTR